MELLLDKHLPQKKDKRRFIFWWFAAILPVALITGYFIISHPADKIEKSINQRSPIKKINNNTTSTQQPNLQQKISVSNDDEANTSKLNADIIKEETEETTADNLNKKDKQKIIFKRSPGSIFFKTDGEISTVNKNDEPLLKNVLNKNDKNNSVEPDVAIAEKEKETVKQENKKTVSSITDTSTIKEKNPTKSSDKTVAKKRASKNNFYITFTTGLESSGTKLGNLGAVKPVYGAGLQYSSGKIFLRTGALVTKKIYAAKDKDYNRKAGTWMSNVTFDNIDANCKVVEVSVTVGYQISSNKKTNVYVAAGSSSFFMKKEDYQFYFKGQSGNDTTRAASFTNNSNHYFSSINLSAGIEQKVTGKLSITAEPQIKIPVSGIGFGKIKLYGAGVLIIAKLKLK